MAIGAAGFFPHNLCSDTDADEAGALGRPFGWVKGIATYNGPPALSPRKGMSAVTLEQRERTDKADQSKSR